MNKIAFATALVSAVIAAPLNHLEFNNQLKSDGPIPSEFKEYTDGGSKCCWESC